ncbi:uncharacterized protein GGS22DRAFT_198395 [Annulohypoxylon maeteangense]|uniref:uncharacterized protein n=1 Tax=Annulohypoxylon maeteangense TaxID=1927788 RepID=UPI002007B6CA|nr:uncharacterized protein GGS22DRAFT_198395 [Annulohypoxylon maeteangense]KAI0880079.1 hypothetical protein GGS22DRAFT_198395 [Annulohypoxylon maeteangense]
MSRRPPPEPDSSPKIKSRWSEIEDNILKQAVARHGVSHWDDVARLIWTKKSAEECRARWAEIVPLLHDGLAQREHDLGQRRKRSMTAFASVSETPQNKNTPSFERLPPPLIQDRKGEEESTKTQSSVGFKSNIQRHTEPPSPSSRAPSTTKPPPSSLAVALTARGRRNTEPGVRPSQTAAESRNGERQGREWMAPHPLMPGRSRKQSISRNVAVSRNDDST